MASHRKSRPAGTRVAGIRTPALATAALTSVALLSQSAGAAPADDRPSLEEVEKKVGDLYRQAESATGTYNTAKGKTAAQRGRVDALPDDVPQRTQKLNEARTGLGSSAAARYGTGASAPDTAASPLAESPRDPFGRTQPTGPLTSRQNSATDDYATGQSAPTGERQETTDSPRTPAGPRSDLRTAKATVQKKLAAARGLLSRPATEERARLAAIEREQQREAVRNAAEPARQQAAAEQRAAETAAAPRRESSPPAPGSGAVAVDASYTAKAERALAFLRAQIGKPYVWGATGPGSYDGSGLTRAAWKAAGVSLPRTTHAQAGAGTTIPLSAARPGDLVFFHDDISHVGVYIGNGMMIHAPKPGAYIREEPVFHAGESAVHSAVRPA